jgi:uncharacterized protein (TIGR02453 family)
VRNLPGRFNGFFPETLEFFQNIRFNNEKMWFEEHRDDFEAYVKSPMEALCLDLEPIMAQLDPSLDTRSRRVVSRIYRDARYAKGVPYRDHMWLSYKPMGKSNSEAFTYYFYIQEDAWGVGVGLYDRVPEIQEHFRHRLFTEGELWRTLLVMPQMKDFVLEADGPKRPKPVDLPEDIARWYHYRRFTFDASYPIGPEVFSGKLEELIVQRFKALEPIYRFVQGWDVELPG